MHYAIVLDVKNSKNTSTLTVIPLRSKKDKNTSYQNLYMVPLGGVLSDLIVDKAKAMVNVLNQEADDLAKKYPIDVIRTDKSLQSRVIKLRKQHKDAMAVLSYLDNLKSESMADIGQITTISKQRIKAPVRTTDVLTNIILPDELLNNLETKLKFLYFSCENP